MNHTYTDDVAAPPRDTATTADFQTRLLRLMGLSVFLLFFQTYMVAPLIPSLADSLHVSRQAVGLLIPAYALPYAIAALVCGILADRFGRRIVLFISLAAFALLGFGMAAAPGLEGLLFVRVLSGLTNVGIAVTGLSLIGDIFPPAQRGRAIGWVFGAIAGGASFGSTLGGILSPLIGWRGLFLLIAVAGVFTFLWALPLWKLLQAPQSTARITVSQLASQFAGYLALLRSHRGVRTYGYIILNGIFHSGVFTWLGALLHDRYELGDMGIGLALLGYGIPGLLLGPAIGKVVDRQGRRLLIPAGLLTAATAAILLALPVSIMPLGMAVIAITVLSLGFDMSHPLFAGIAMSLDGERRGQAMGLNTFSLFLGLGCGSLIFGWLAQSSLSLALGVFGSVQIVLGLFAFRLFREE